MKRQTAISKIKEGLAVNMEEGVLIESILAEANGKIGTETADEETVEALIKEVKHGMAESPTLQKSQHKKYEEWICRTDGDELAKIKLVKTVALPEATIKTLNSNPLKHGNDVIKYFEKEAEDA